MHSHLHSLTRPRSRKPAIRRKRKALGFEPLETRALLTTFAVTSTSDSGPGSLRQAMLDANAMAGADVIEFNIPTSDANFVDVDSRLPGGDPGPDVFLIQPTTPLPALDDSSGGTTIDGATQAQFVGRNTNVAGPEIVLDGQRIVSTGLRITSHDNRVVGLNIQRFLDDGVAIAGGDRNMLAGNFIGVDAAGTTAAPNTGDGVSITNGGQGNVVGTNGDGQSDSAERNVISGNLRNGVLVLGDENIVAGNYIGTDVNGLAALGNEWLGVSVGAGVQRNRVGTNGDRIGDAAERNVISANFLGGIDLVASQTTIAGNFIGTDATGSAALGNKGVAIWLFPGSAANTIGTDGDGVADVAERNIVSGNGEGIVLEGDGSDSNAIAGNYIGTDVSGTMALGNDGPAVWIRSGAERNRVGTNGDGLSDAQERNLISGNGEGVVMGGIGTDANVVAGNYVGTDVTGATALGNGAPAVWIRWGAQSNRVGTNADGVSDDLERNIISGNGEGVVVDGVGTELNVIAGNYIGTDLTGTVDLGSNRPAVWIRWGAQFNLLGTNADGIRDERERNIISGNDGGIVLDGVDTAFNTIAGNFIGTDISGSVDLGNSDTGVVIFGGASNNTIGGATAAARNIISGNDNDGILITESGSDQNLVLGNYIGVDVSGSVALGNSGDGVRIDFGAEANVIGTNGDGLADTQERNVISANSGHGVVIKDADTHGNVVAGNYIGTDVTGALALGNSQHGVFISKSHGNSIGITSPDAQNLVLSEANTIAFNGLAGVSVVAGTANSIRGNAIHSNTLLGIDLVGGIEDSFGVTANDTGDRDTGPNVLQNFPTILRARIFRGNTFVVGLLTSAPNSTFLIDVYGSEQFDPSGFGEGQRYLGSFSVVTNARGRALILGRLPITAVNGEFISATATNLDGSTSEFSGPDLQGNVVIATTLFAFRDLR